MRPNAPTSGKYTPGLLFAIVQTRHTFSVYFRRHCQGWVSVTAGSHLCVRREGGKVLEIGDERGQPLRQRLIRLRRWHPGGLALSLPANLHAARRSVGQGKAMICDVRTAKIIISGALKLYGLQRARPKFAPSFASERIPREIEKERPARKEIYLLQ
jgi:hypothetical protein